MTGVNIYMFLYFVAFIVFAVFLTANIIVGGLIDNIQRFVRSNQNKSNIQNDVPSSEDTTESTEKTDKTCCSKMCNFVRSQRFGCITFWICVANIVTLTFDHYQASQDTNLILNILNIIFILLLIIETVLRMLSGGKSFFTNGWNWFDLVITISAIIGKFERFNVF